MVHDSWTAEKDGLLSQIRRSALLLGEDSGYLQSMLTHLVENEPAVPLLPVLFFEDTTQEALASHIATGWPSTSLWSDEGGLIVGGHGMQSSATKFVALLNRLWDGNPFTAHRKTSKSFTVTNRRLTISLMMQPMILDQLVSKNGGIGRQSGFLARSLIASPESEMGNRFYQEPPIVLASLPEFHARVTECLDSTLELDKNGCHDLPTIELSKKAKMEWISFFNQTESGLRDPRQWGSIKDFASKAAENVARLSALFHLFDGKEGDVNAENMDRAVQIVRWHLYESRRVLGGVESTPVDPKKRDSKLLLRWMIEKELSETSPRYLQQYSPIHDKTKRDVAIDQLCEDGCLKKTKIGKRTALLLNPSLLK